MSRHRPRNAGRSSLAQGRGPAVPVHRTPLPRRGEAAPAPLSGVQWALLIMLLLATAAVFSPVLRAEYLNYDDDIYVTENPYVRRLDAQSVQTLFTTHYQNQYAPVAMLLMATEFKVFESNATALRWVSILVHLANVALLFVLMRRLFPRFEVALITAALFAVHPLQVESVAWITAHMKLGWYVLFGLASLVAYTAWAQSGRAWTLGVSVALFALSCLSKEQGVALVGTLPMIDYVLGRDLRKGRLWLEKLPYLALAIAIGSATLGAAGSQQGRGQMLVVFGLAERVTLAAYVFASYLGKLVAPVQLSAFDVYPLQVPGLYALSFVAVAAVLAFLAYAWQRGWKVVVFGITFYLTHLALTLANQIFALRDVMMADRYLYLPAAGAFLVIAHGWDRLCERVAQMRIILTFVLLTWLSWLGFSAYLRTAVWQNSIALFSDVLAKETASRGANNPFLALPYNNRGVARKNRGDIEGGLADFNEAVRINDRDARARVNRANVYFNRQEFERALPDYDQAIALDPRNAIAHANRGSVYAMRNRFDLALADFNKALELQPDFLDALRGRGMVHQVEGRHEEAVRDFDRYLSLRANPEISDLRAQSLQALGRKP